MVLNGAFQQVKRGISLWLTLSGANAFAKVIAEHPALRHRAVSAVMRAQLFFEALKQTAAQSPARVSAGTVRSLELSCEEVQELQDIFVHRPKEVFLF